MNGGSSGLRLGEAIPSGGLLTADGTGAHSIVVLMPDGQRLLCECYEARTCAQGFRVPAIALQPAAVVWAMFVAVRNVLLMRPATASAPFAELTGPEEAAANVETVAPLQAQNIVSLAPALRVLPRGSYRLEVHADGPLAGALSAPSPAASIQPLQWDPARATAPVQVAGAGLYRITVVDSTRIPRIEIELLATPSGTVASETDSLKKMRLTVIDWNRTHEGWSLHDFLHVYLQSRAIALSQ